MSDQTQDVFRWPVVILDRDGWLYCLTDQEKGFLEEIDVEEREHVGIWDATGIPLRVAWIDGRAVFEIISDVPDKESAEEAIYRFATRYGRRSNIPFSPTRREIGPMALEAIEFVDKQTGIVSLFRWLCKSLGLGRKIHL